MPRGMRVVVTPSARNYADGARCRISDGCVIRGRIIASYRDHVDVLLDRGGVRYVHIDLIRSEGRA